MSHKKLLQMIGMMLIILSLGCGIPAIAPASEAPGATDMPEAPAAADTPEAPAATNTPKPPTATPTSDAILAVEITEKPVDFGDVQKMSNGEVKIWLGFGGTLKNIGNVTLTDLRVCVDFNYKTTPWEYDCGDVPDLAVGETKKYGAGFYLEGKSETVKDLLKEGSYVITVKSGDNKVGINKATK